MFRRSIHFICASGRRDISVIYYRLIIDFSSLSSFWRRATGAAHDYAGRLFYLPRGAERQPLAQLYFALEVAGSLARPHSPFDAICYAQMFIEIMSADYDIEAAKRRPFRHGISLSLAETRTRKFDRGRDA